MIDGAYPRTSNYLSAAVLYGNVPESNSSVAGGVGAYSTYLKRLMHEQLARESMEEEASSDPSALIPGSRVRVAQLTEKVKNAYSEANGNTADGRWAVVSDLLRLHSTRGGRHWIGVDSGVGAPEIPKTNEDRQESERRTRGAEDVNSKVQRWIATSEFEPLTPDVTVIHGHALTNQLPIPLGPPHIREKPKGSHITETNGRTTLKAVSQVHDPLSSRSNFGFNVVKRPNAPIKDKPKSNESPGDSTPAPEFPVLQIVQGNVGLRTCALASDERPRSSLPLHSDTADVSDSNLHHPSFRSSQILTSTPILNPNNHFQERGLLRSLNNLPSPNTTQTYYLPRRPSLSSQPHVLELSHSQGGVISERKREGSQPLEEAPMIKKPRMVVDDSSQQRPSQPSAPDARATPCENSSHSADLASSTRHPHKERCSISLQDALRSNESSQLEHQFPISPTRSASKVNGSTLDAHGGVSMPLHVPEPYQTSQAINAAFDVVQRRLRPGPESPSIPPSTSNMLETTAPEAIVKNPLLEDSLPRSMDVESQADAEASVKQAMIVQELRQHTPTPSPKHYSLRFPSIGPESLSPKAGATTYHLYGLDDLDCSPTKSLSSLAGSDSGSDETDERTADNASLSKRLHIIDADFNPQHTSTQKLGFNYALASDIPISSDSRSHEKLPSRSQIQAEVNSQVNEFDKFMEADLGYEIVVPGL